MDMPASGIFVPRDELLEAREVAPGLYVVEDAYQQDLGYFGVSPLYKSGPASSTLKQTGADNQSSNGHDPAASTPAATRP